jgi:predicted phosphoribosyltransferase
MDAIFHSRIGAGLLLAEGLRKYDYTHGVVFAVPRGGVPVAFAIASELGLSLEIVLAKKIGHPLNPEYAIGAASLTDHFITSHEDVPDEYVELELQRIRARLGEMETKFMGERKRVDVKGKTVIIVDDGAATGNTLLSTARLMRKNEPSKIIVAVPVASRQAVKKLATAADEVLALYVPGNFLGVGAYYEVFDQLDDEEVIYYLEKWDRLRDENKNHVQHG